MESLAIAVILGIVEGLTEFLPISSTGHLIIAGHLLGFVGEKAASFEVVIQLGAILAVVCLYWRRFARLWPHPKRALIDERSKLDGWDGVWRLALATFPALLVGYLARHSIKAHLFNPEAVTAALALGGVLILAVEYLKSPRASNSIDGLTTWQALGIGLFQILALWPGTSRAAATIIGGMLVGLDRKSAAEFSFLIAVPVLFAAAAYEFVKMSDQLALQEALDLGVGFVVSFIVALVAIKGFVRFLQSGKLTPFAWYRIVVAPIFYYFTRGLHL
jgi:undecaprenyl-diphosphatase